MNIYIKFNAQPLSLTKKDIPKYYEEYFGVKLYVDNKPSRVRADKPSAKYYGSKTKTSTKSSNSKSNSSNTKFGSKSMINKKNIFYGGSDVLTPDANKIMHDYLEGTLWVFDYYFNDRTYINTWYYQYERAPLLTQFSMYLENIDLNHFNEIFDGLSKYQVTDFKKYFNPIEQLIYVSPMTPDIVKLLPANYRDFVTSENLNPFFENYFVDIDMLTDRLWNQKISKEVDCHSIIYFNKCLVKAIIKPTSADDQLFLREIRKVEPSETSDRRSKSKEPPY